MTPRLKVAAALCVLLLTVAACGNRLSHNQIVAAATSGGRTVGVNPTGGTGGTAGGKTVGGTNGTTGQGGTGGTGGGTVGPSVAAGGTVPAGPGSVLVIGTVGNYSGIPGGVTVPGLRGLQAWVAATNAQGGIQGHPIRLVVADDQSDPTKHKAAMQDMVERQHVVAFVGVMAPLTDSAGRSYIEQQAHVPVIVGANTSGVWFQSPYYFAGTGNSHNVLYSQFVTAKRFGGGKTKIATITCVEAATCSDFKNLAPSVAQEAGMSVVDQEDASLATPNFTQQCLNAQNAGAQIVLPVGDQNYGHRVALDCARQGFRPIFISLTPSDSEAGFTPYEGAVAAQGYFPFVGVPGSFTDPYITAMKRYFPNQEKATLSPAGWVAGEIFKKAVTISLQHSNTITSSSILHALWTFKNQTLGGMLLPVTYAQGKPSVVAACWFAVILKNGRWTTPDGAKQTCK